MRISRVVLLKIKWLLFRAEVCHRPFKGSLLQRIHLYMRFKYLYLKPVKWSHNPQLHRKRTAHDVLLILGSSFIGESVLFPETYSITNGWHLHIRVDELVSACQPSHRKTLQSRHSGKRHIYIQVSCNNKSHGIHRLAPARDVYTPLWKELKKTNKNKTFLPSVQWAANGVRIAVYSQWNKLRKPGSCHCIDSGTCIISIQHPSSKCRVPELKARPWSPKAAGS